LKRPHRLARPAPVDQQRHYVELGCQRIRMARAEGLAETLQRLPRERLRLSVAALRAASSLC
jgi:hypothetical protein